MATNEKLNIDVRAKDNASAVLDKVGKKIKKVGDTSGLANNTILNLTRGLNDAKYGFHGLANNAEFVVESFGQMIKKGGGLKVALKSLGSAIMGPIGIVAGLSLIIGYGPEIITFFKSLFGGAEKSKEEIRKLKDEIIAFKKALDDMVKSQNKALGQFDDPGVELLRGRFQSAGNNEGKLNVLAGEAFNKVDELTNQVARDNHTLETISKRWDSLTEAEREYWTKEFENMKGRLALLEQYETLLGQIEAKLDSFAPKQEREAATLANAGIESSGVTTDISGKTKKGKSYSTGFTTSGNLAGDFDIQNREAAMQAFIDKLKELKEMNDIVGDSFENLGNNIAQSLTNQMGVAGAFLGTMAQALTKYLGEYVAFVIAKAKLDATAAGTSAVAGATTAAASTGPAFPGTLPIFIAAALAAVGAALSGVGGKAPGGGGGGARASRPRSSSPTLTQTQGFGGSNRTVGELELRGQNLVVALQAANETRTRY